MNPEHSEVLTRARRLLADGALAQSLKEYEVILAQDPLHVEALNAIGMWSARSGNLQRSLEILRRAQTQAPDDPLTLHNLAQVHQAIGDTRAALEAYQQVLRLKPDLYAARLAAAYLLEESGRAAEALPVYFRAVTDGQRDGRWLSPASTARNLQPLVQHAFEVINNGRRALYAGIIEPWTKRYGAIETARVVRCLRSYLGDEVEQSGDAAQRPTFLYFPGLPARPYLDRALVPQLHLLEAQTDAISVELASLLERKDGLERVFLDPRIEDANLRGSIGRPRWDGYYFDRHGELRESNREACPLTAAALEGLPICRIRGHAPELLFSILHPGTHLLPHRGMTNTRIVGHLPLLVPDDCALRVLDQEHLWKRGEVVLFDDTYLHEAWNRSERIRVVLIFDLWNPHLSEVERLMVAELVGAIGDFHKAGELFKVDQ